MHQLECYQSGRAKYPPTCLAIRERSKAITQETDKPWGKKGHHQRCDLNLAGNEFFSILEYCHLIAVLLQYRIDRMAPHSDFRKLAQFSSTHCQSEPAVRFLFRWPGDLLRCRRFSDIELCNNSIGVGEFDTINLSSSGDTPRTRQTRIIFNIWADSPA